MFSKWSLHLIIYYCCYFVEEFSFKHICLTETDKGLPHEKIKDIAINASDKVYEQDYLGPVQSIKNSLAFTLTQITQVSQFLQDNEYDIAVGSKNEDKVSIP